MDQKITKDNASDVSPKYDPIEDSMSVLLGVCNLVTPPSECKQRLTTTGYVDRILADFIKDYSMNSFVEYGDVSQTSPTFARDLQNFIINGVRPFRSTDCENISRLAKHSDKKGINQTTNSNDNSSVDCKESSGTLPSGLSFHSICDSSDNQRVPSPSGHDLTLEFMSRSQYCAHSLESDLSLTSEHKTGDRNKSDLNRLDPDGAEDDLVRRITVGVHGPSRIHSKDKSLSTCTYARSRYNNTKRHRRSSYSSQPLASSTMISDNSVTEFCKPDLFSSMTSSSFNGKLNRFQSVDKENIQHVDDSDVSHKTTKRLRRSLNASSNLHSVDDSAYSFNINGGTLKPVAQHRKKISNQNKRQNRAIRLQTIRDSEGASLQNDVYTNIDDLSHIKGQDHSNEKQSTLPRTSTTVWSIDDKSVTLRERFTLKPLNGQNGTKTKQVCDPSSNFTSFDYDYSCTDSSAWYTDDIENTFGDMLVPNNSCLSIPNCDYISQAAPSSHNSFLLTSIDDTAAMSHLKPKSVIRRTSTPLPSHDVPIFRKICKRSHSDRKNGFDKKTLKHKLKHFRHSCSKEKSSVQSIRTLARL